MDRNLRDRKQLVNGDRFAVDVRRDLCKGANSSNPAVGVEVEVDLTRESYWHGHDGRHSKGNVGVNDGCTIASEVFVLPSDRGKHLTSLDAEVNDAVTSYGDRYWAAPVGIAIKLEGVSETASITVNDNGGIAYITVEQGPLRSGTPNGIASKAALTAVTPGWAYAYGTIWEYLIRCAAVQLLAVGAAVASLANARRATKADDNILTQVVEIANENVDVELDVQEDRASHEGVSAKGARSL